MLKIKVNYNVIGMINAKLIFFGIFCKNINMFKDDD